MAFTPKYDSIPPRETALNPGLFRSRADLNRRYLMSLGLQNLMQNYYLEAGLGDFGRVKNTSVHRQEDDGEGRHWGWESPSCQLRGHFTGHWLSAAARLYANSGDAEALRRAKELVAELERCRVKQGGDWFFSIPEKYLAWTAAGKPTWAPLYVIHKTLMGLSDMVLYADDALSLELLKAAARWFTAWSQALGTEGMDRVLDYEHGGWVEVWAELYAKTNDPAHLELMRRFEHRRYFEALRAGKDMLTNRHANTTIPEVLGCARAYEVTGEERYREIVEAYWSWAVDRRGTFCTGGQTLGEIWTPPFAYAARRGAMNQEHCVVYNMIRLADFLFRWTGKSSYLDYIERNLYNGILAQQHPGTGMISYFLPLKAGGRKIWGHPTNDFWCCHGSLVQAHTLHNAWIFAKSVSDITVCQYLPAVLETELGGTKLRLEQRVGESQGGGPDDNSREAGAPHRPQRLRVNLRLGVERATRFALRLRIPAWITAPATLSINGEPQVVHADADGFITLSREWKDDALVLDLPKGLRVHAIPDEPETMAFLDGPVVLAGLWQEERALVGDKAHPEAILKPDNERQWGVWNTGWRSVGQEVSLRFKPLYEVIDEAYTLYFPVRAR